MENYVETVVTAIVTIIMIIVLMWVFNIIYGNDFIHYYEIRHLNNYYRRIEDTNSGELQLVPWIPELEYTGFAGTGTLENEPPLLSVLLKASLKEPHQSKSTSHLPSKEVYTPFLEACWDCDVNKIVSFIQEGVDPRQKTRKGETGLVLMTYRMAKRRTNWNPECLNILVYSGCSINEPTKAGNTALHLAVKQGHKEVIEWLLKHGASVFTENKAGWRPIGIARAQGREDLVEILLEAEDTDECSGTDNNQAKGGNDDTASEYYSAL